MSEDKMGDFFCIAATTSGRVRIGFEGGDFKWRSARHDLL